MSKRLSIWLVMVLVCSALTACSTRAAYVGSVSTVNELVSNINPTGINTNYFVNEIASILAWASGDATPTNAIPDGPFESWKASGRWFVIMKGVSNSFTTLYVSNFFATNIYVTNLYSTNIYATNIYVTNINDVIYTPNIWTNELGNYRPVENQNQVSVTNLQSAQTLVALGAFVMPRSESYLVYSGHNTINPYQQGFVWISSDADSTTPASRTVCLETGNGQGQILFIENRPYTVGGVTQSAFSITNNTPICSGGGIITLANGDWLPTKTGETLMLQNDGTDWREVGRFFGAGGGDNGNLWTNKAGILKPKDSSLPVEVDNLFLSGPTTYAWWNGSLSGEEVFLSFRSETNSEPTKQIIELDSAGYGGSGTSAILLNTNRWEFTAAVNQIGQPYYAFSENLGASGNTLTFSQYTSGGGGSPTNGVMIGPGVSDSYPIVSFRPYVTHTVGNLFELLNVDGTTNFAANAVSGWTGTGNNVFKDNGTFGPAASLPDILWTNKSSILQPKDLTLPVMITNQLSFSQGMTNVLKQNQADLEYTNGASATKIIVSNGSGGGAIVYAQGTSAATFGVNGSANTVNLNNGSDVAQLFSHSWHPTTDGFVSLGSETGLRWKNQSLLGTNFIFGYRGVGTEITNFSRLAIHQVSTNDPVVFDIQTWGAGTNGANQGFSFRTNGVEIGKFPDIDGAFPLAFKSSFTTNYTVTTNAQFYMLAGTNQLITLPSAVSASGMLYRFSSTNGRGSFVITNAADGSKIRDGTSLSYTNIGINEVGFVSDGSNWWLASKGKTVFPSASWSLTNSLTPTQDVITNIYYTSLEFNNSQGIALLTKAGYTGATELWVTNAGTYMITFSAVLKGNSPANKISIWLRQNGTDVPRTRTDQIFSANTAQQCMTVNYFVSVGATPSYFELCAASHDAGPPTIISDPVNPTGFTAPAMPGIIVTVNRVSDTWP